MQRFASSQFPLHGAGAMRRLAIAAVSLFVVGCASTKPTSVVRLEVSEIGAYSVDGTSVEPAGLIEALRSKRQPGKQLLVHLVPSPGAKYQAVQKAVSAVQQVGGNLGIVANERF